MIIKRGYIIACLSATCFGLASIFGKCSYNGGNTAISMTFYRALITVGIIYLILSIKKKQFSVEKKYIPQIIILGIFGQTLTTILINMAYYYIPAGTALTLHFLYPAIVTLVCVLFLKEKVSIIKLFVIFVAFLGTLFFFDGLTSDGTAGLIFALTSSVTWAFYIIYLEKSQLSNIDPFLLAFYQCIILAVCCFIWGNFTGEMRYIISASGWFNIVVSAILFCLAIVLLQIGVNLLGSTTASILGVFEPISSLLFGFIILHEMISKKQIIGTIIILIAVVVLMIGDRKVNSVE